jgi:hypothetical protein
MPAQGQAAGSACHVAGLFVFHPLPRLGCREHNLQACATGSVKARTFRPPPGLAWWFMLSREQIAALFQETGAQIKANRNLRVPQVEGHAAAREFFAGGGHRAVEQIPVGCGKTGLMTILPFGIAEGRVLVIAPNLQIKQQLAAALDVTGPECFYRKAAC